MIFFPIEMQHQEFTDPFSDIVPHPLQNINLPLPPHTWRKWVCKFHTKNFIGKYSVHIKNSKNWAFLEITKSCNFKTIIYFEIGRFWAISGRFLLENPIILG